MTRELSLLWKIFKVHYCIKPWSAHSDLHGNSAFSMKSEFKPTGFSLTVLWLNLRLWPDSRQNRKSGELLLNISFTEVLLLPPLCGKNSTTNPNSKLKTFLQSQCHGNKTQESLNALLIWIQKLACCHFPLLGNCRTSAFLSTIMQPVTYLHQNMKRIA